MICSGWQRLAMVPLSAADSDAVDSLIFALKRNRPGRLQISPRGLEFQPRKKPVLETAFTFKTNEDWLYREEAGQRPTLTIIGGGHVGLALSRVMAELNFHIVVLDDRARLATMAANTYAQEKQVTSYNRIGRHVREGSQSYVVIMTFGHLADERVLGQLAGKKLRFLGHDGQPGQDRPDIHPSEKEGHRRRQPEKGPCPGRPADLQPYAGGDRCQHRCGDHPDQKPAEIIVTRNKGRGTACRAQGNS